MAVKIRLNDGITLVARADLEQFTEAYQRALRNNEILEVENGDGKMRRLNPAQILYFEDADEVFDESDQADVSFPEGLQVQ
jgi:hypothetical protein